MAVQRKSIGDVAVFNNRKMSLIIQPNSEDKDEDLQSSGNIANAMLCAVADLGTVRFAQEKDLLYVLSLSKKENFSLGFIPKMAYESAVTGIKKGDRWSEVCNDKLFVIECNNDLVGFCLASFGRIGGIGKMGKIAQICLQVDARMMQRGRLLLDAVIEYGKKKGTFRWACGCADDLPSNLFWQTMGWIKIADRQGISYKNTWKQTSKRKVNVYRLDPYDLFAGSNGT